MADDPPVRVKWRDASWEGRGRRIATWAFLAFAAWFIVSTVLQIARSALGSDAPLAMDGPCRGQLAGLVRAADRATEAAAARPDRDEAARAFRTSLAPEWDALAAAEGACATDPRSRQAYLDVLRLRDARERSLARAADEVGAIRRSLGRRLDLN